MARQRTLISVYAATHFLVDFACAFLFFGGLTDSADLYLSFLLYNFCAFALQMPLGLLADRLNRNALTAAAGCVLVAAAYALTGLPVAAAIVAGIGNGLFHLGGGIETLNAGFDNQKALDAPGTARRGRLSLLGVFVAPGAFGIFLGKLLGKQEAIPAMAAVIVLLAAAVFILRLGFSKERRFRSRNVSVSFDGAGASPILAAALCLFLVVCLRSYAGMVFSFPWSRQGAWSWALVAAVVIGKIAGGFLADRFGCRRTALVSLAAAAVLFLLPGIPVAAVAAVLLFNMTMPVTLWALARLFNAARGFAFGVLTFGLFLGFLPGYLGYPAPLDAGIGFAAASAVSLVLLGLGLRRTA